MQQQIGRIQFFDKARETLHTPASSARFVTYRMFVKPSFFLNLPGWRWGSITQNPLVAVSRPLHSGVCETRQDAGLPVLHSKISDSGLLRTRYIVHTLAVEGAVTLFSGLWPPRFSALCPFSASWPSCVQCMSWPRSGRASLAVVARFLAILHEAWLVSSWLASAS